jgi:hypothetical protein
MTCGVNKLSGGNGEDSMHGNSVVCDLSDHLTDSSCVHTFTNGSNTSTVAKPVISHVIRSSRSEDACKSLVESVHPRSPLTK